MPSLVGLGFNPPPRRQNTLRFCLSATLLNVRVCSPDFAMKALEYRNSFDADRQAKICSCAPVFNLLRLTPTVDITKCRIPKNGKNWGFLLPEDDRMNLIGRRVSVQEPPNVKICQKLRFSATGSRHNEHIHSASAVYKLAATVHLCLRHRAPRYLTDYCVPVSEVSGRQHLRYARCHQLSVPRVRPTALGTRAFSVAGPTLWNSLPDHLRDHPAVDYEQFRRDLKTYLFAGHS